MRVRVIFFGVLRELAGAAERETELQDGATVQDVVEEWERLLPGTGIWPSIATAVNQEYAARTRPVVEGDVIALLPPVSGGLPQGKLARQTSNRRRRRWRSE